MHWAYTFSIIRKFDIPGYRVAPEADTWFIFLIQQINAIKLVSPARLLNHIKIAASKRYPTLLEVKTNVTHVDI